jgi:hypothetical protein
VPVVGEEIRIGRKLIRNGVIRHAKDPQRMSNYFHSAHTETVALQPKAPFLVTETNVAKYQSTWDELMAKLQAMLVDAKTKVEVAHQKISNRSQTLRNHLRRNLRFPIGGSELESPPRIIRRAIGSLRNPWEMTSGSPSIRTQ